MGLFILKKEDNGNKNMHRIRAPHAGGVAREEKRGKTGQKKVPAFRGRTGHYSQLPETSCRHLLTPRPGGTAPGLLSGICR